MYRVVLYFVVTLLALLFLLFLWGVPFPSHPSLALPCAEPKAVHRMFAADALMVGLSAVTNGLHVLARWCHTLKNTTVLPRLLISFLVVLLNFYAAARLFTWFMLVESVLGYMLDSLHLFTFRELWMNASKYQTLLWSGLQLVRGGEAGVIQKYNKYCDLREDVFQRWRDEDLTYNRSSAVELLPSQRDILHALASIVVNVDIARPGPVIGLRGGWGVGKSFILDSLKEALDPRDGRRRSFTRIGEADVAVVTVNIWHNETEPDLHYTIVKNILAHPKILRKCLHRYPPLFLFAPARHVLSRCIPYGMRLNLHFAHAAMDAKVVVPLRWQEALRRAAEKWHKSNLKVVIILEEIDRADPPMAQAAITLSKRALELPGVTVIIPYVEEQMRYKVFNPLHCYSPDLASSMYAILHKERSIDLNSLGAEHIPDLVKQYHDFTSPSVERPEGNTASWSLDKVLALGRDVDIAFAAHYLSPAASAGATRLWKDRLYELFSDKFLSYHMEVKQLTPDDVPAILKNAAEFRNLSILRDVSDDKIVAIVVDVLLVHHLRLDDAPSARTLIGKMMHFVSLKQPTEPYEVLEYVYLAYIAASVRGRIPKEKSDENRAV